MMNIQYAGKGEKIKDSAIPQLKWPLIDGVLISSDTTKLGPEDQQSTYIREKYQNEAGDKISVTKALHHDGYRSISILNNGQEFNQGYRPDGSINYTVTPEQYKKDKMNYLEYTKLVPKGQEGLKDGIQPGAYYVTYPNQGILVKNQINNGKGVIGRFANKVVDLLDGRKNDGRLALGHGAVITVDNNGGTQYHEYGRYNEKKTKGNLIGKVLPSYDGNWNRVRVPDVTRYLNKDGEVDHQAYANAIAKQFGEDAQLTWVDNADPTKVRKAIQTDANNAKRDEYSIFTKSCGSEACAVIDEGQSGFRNFIDGAKRVVKGAVGLAGGPALWGQTIEAIGGFTPAAKRRGLESSGYKTYSSN